MIERRHERSKIRTSGAPEEMIMNVASRKQLVETLIPIIRNAGMATLKRRNDKLVVRTKDDGSPVTDADLASHAILRAGCQASCPAIPVISEEDLSAATAHQGTNGALLLIDPLD